MNDDRFTYDSDFVSWSTLVGKTIHAVNAKLGSNVVLLTFTDGTSIMVASEPIGHGLHTPVLYVPNGG